MTALLLFACTAAAPNLASATVTAAAGISWQPARLVRGSPVLFRVRAPAGTKKLSGKWLGHELNFFAVPADKGWYALAAIPVETAAGVYDLEISGTKASTTFHYRKRIRVAPAHYAKIAIHVATKFTEPSPEQLKQIAADKEVKQSTFAKETEKRLWAGDFQSPVTAATSDPFGTERVFNGEVKSRHLGLDFAVGPGTPVHAINRGTIILARPLYFEGGFVVIDHGQGLMSLYLHLSEFKVKEGDEVSTGQLIALSGGSGRATGPHLHLAVRWQGIYLNPEVLLRLRLPESSDQ
jgi:murein DD-endopeptidase MepM/ murein hydrolase activator NlpD